MSLLDAIVLCFVYDAEVVTTAVVEDALLADVSDWNHKLNKESYLFQMFRSLSV